MIVNEIFYSLQGEGFFAGLPSVFIRLAGCQLRCQWCDTKYAWDELAGRQQAIDEVIKAVQQYDCRFVVITGGEPMINQDISQLSNELKALQKHVTIETAGVKFVPDLACDLMSVSPKLDSSLTGESYLAEISQLIGSFPYQLKFVVDSSADLSRIEGCIKKIGTVDRARVLLMPQAATRDELIAKLPMVAEMCKKTGFALSARLQVMIWDDKRGV
jgi:7-carboxy-7-deazaguanine synthase